MMQYKFNIRMLPTKAIESWDEPKKSKNKNKPVTDPVSVLANSELQADLNNLEESKDEVPMREEASFESAILINQDFNMADEI